MCATDIWAVVPIKEASAAKQRLAECVPAPLRAELALVMFEDVIEALSRAVRLAGIIVVTEDVSAASIGRRYGARIDASYPRGGHTAVVAAAARMLRDEGRAGILQVPGDVPLVSSAEIDHLLAAHPTAPSFTIVPSHDFMGSNAVVISPPDAVPLTFGDNSFYPHIRTARALGIEPTIMRSPGLALDIDTPADVRMFASLLSSTRTQDFIDRHDLYPPTVAAKAG